MSEPYLDEGMRGWIARTARQNLWRIQGLDFEDLVQEGYICYCKCRNAYAELAQVELPSKEQRRMFQALVKTAFTNHLHTLAAKGKGGTMVPVSSYAVEGESEGSVWDRLMQPDGELGTLAATLASLPSELTELMKILATDGFSLVKFERRKCHRRALRETTNEMYCRLLGLPPGTDVRAKLAEHFGTASE